MYGPVDMGQGHGHVCVCVVRMFDECNMVMDDITMTPPAYMDDIAWASL